MVLAAVVLVSLVLARFKQSLMIGYFLCGLILSGSGLLAWAGADSLDTIRALSDLGVVLLLFTLGIEFSVKELKALKRPAFLGGGLQMGLCTGIGWGVACALGMPWNHGVVIGFALALSSTAVSLKAFQDLGQPETPQARVALGMALFQDIAVVFFVVLLSSLLGSADQGFAPLGLALLKALGFVGSAIFLARYGLPQMLDAVARTRSRELFTVTVVGLCVIVALIAGLLGLSPALGAFVAGVVISESIYSHRVMSEILPFKDLFLTLFFVSIGLLIDLDQVMENWMIILGTSLAILVVKGLIVAWAGRLSGLRRGHWWVTAAALSSSGEFSLVLLNRAAELGALSPRNEQILLAVTALTMSLVPFLMKRTTRNLAKRRSETIAGSGDDSMLGMIGEIEEIHDHVILCGYGPVGMNLHRNLRRANVPVVVLEMNPQTVKSLLEVGVFCLFADATHGEALELAHIERARALVFSFPDADTIKEASRVAKQLNPNLIIHARVKFGTERDGLSQNGIEHVFHDEEQSGKALIRSVMGCYENSADEEWF